VGITFGGSSQIGVLAVWTVPVGEVTSGLKWNFGTASQQIASQAFCLPKPSSGSEFFDGGLPNGCLSRLKMEFHANLWRKTAHPEKGELDSGRQTDDNIRSGIGERGVFFSRLPFLQKFCVGI
jgi:hypothetical protein